MEKTKITLDDISPELYKELEDAWYRSFDFMKLYQPSNVPSLIGQFGTHILIAINVLTLIFLFLRT